MTTTGVMLRTERLAAGECRHVIDADLRAGRVIAPFRGVHVAGADLTLRERWLAAYRVQRGDGWLSHRSAAVALDLPWLPPAWSEAAACVDVTLPPGVRRRQRDGLRLFWHPLPQTPKVVEAVPVTPPARTLLDLVRDEVVTVEHGVTLIDGALREGRVTPTQLQAELLALDRGRGFRRAEAAVAAARCGVDSPGETRVRLALISGGVPADDLVVPVEVRERDGVLLARGDFGNPALLLWGEYDGLEVHTQPHVFSHDRVRQRWLEGRGWQVLRFSRPDLDRPGQIAREWLAAAAAAPARILAMDPSRSPEVAEAQARLATR